MNQSKEFKTCTRCGETFPANLEFFMHEERGKYGVTSRCISCIKIIHREYREKNSEKIKQRHKDYRKNNREAVLVYHKNYRQTHKEQERQYRQDNKERFAKSRKEYYEKNKDRIGASNKANRLKKKEAGIIPFRIYGSKFRSKERGIPYNYTLDDWNECKDFFGYCCAYCGSSEDLQQDHVVPMSRGGRYYPDNIVCSCRSCNASKRASDMETWYRNKPFFNEGRLEIINKFLVSRRASDFNAEGRNDSVQRR